MFKVHLTKTVINFYIKKIIFSENDNLALFIFNYISFMNKLNLIKTLL